MPRTGTTSSFLLFSEAGMEHGIWFCSEGVLGSAQVVPGLVLRVVCKSIASTLLWDCTHKILAGPGRNWFQGIKPQSADKYVLGPLSLVLLKSCARQLVPWGLSAILPELSEEWVG